MRNILIYLYDILTYHDTMRNDIMTFIITKQIYTLMILIISTITLIIPTVILVDIVHQIITKQ